MTTYTRLPSLRELTDADSVKQSHRQEQRIDGHRYAKQILEQAHHAWDNLRPFREQRQRCKRFTYGNQWGDLMRDERGCLITEEEFIRRQGSVPLCNNLIHRLVKTVTGVWRNQNVEPTCQAIDRDEQQVGDTMTVVLQANMRKNKLQNMLGKLLNEMLISGVACTKETIEWRKGIKDCFTYSPKPDYLFFDGTMSDYRLWDLNMIGEIHDLMFNDLCEKFAKSPAQFQHLRDIYSSLAKEYALSSDTHDTLNTMGFKDHRHDFLVPQDRSRCRVIEVWTKERKPRLHVTDPLHGELYDCEVSDKSKLDMENAQRRAMARRQGMPEDEIPLIEYDWFIDAYWYYRFLTPTGEVLMEGESPYAHREHPYTLTIYPMIDGEAHSFVSDVIDQQKYINRLITLNDWVIRASTKGVMMFPADALPDNMSIDDVRTEMTRPNGFILFKPGRSGAEPKQLSSRNNNIGMAEMIQLQCSLMEDISGITGALQGKQQYAGVSGALYAQQQQQASNSLVDLLESFNQFVHDTVLKKVYNIQASYDTQRIVTIVGRHGTVLYNPDTMGDIEFDLNIVEMPSTTVARAANDQMLLQLQQQQLIDLRTMLELGNFPFGDRLLQKLDEQQAAMQQGQPYNQPLPQDLQQQIRQSADQDAVQQAAQQMGPQPVPGYSTTGQS